MAEMEWRAYETLYDAIRALEGIYWYDLGDGEMPLPIHVSLTPRIVWAGCQEKEDADNKASPDIDDPIMGPLKVPWGPPNG